tara:strand:+ start:1089 stop:1364 length:276 start_codon:yes stop_codon:yes gene_type:complete
MKYNRSDNIYMVKRDVDSFSLSFANEKDAEDVCIQFNQDLRDAYGDDYPPWYNHKEFYVKQSMLYGAEEAEKFKTSKQSRLYFLSMNLKGE